MNLLRRELPLSEARSDLKLTGLFVLGPALKRKGGSYEISFSRIGHKNDHQNI